MILAIILIVAIGTYLTRLLPLLFKQKLKFDEWGEILSYSSTALISALFVTSFVSFPIDPKELSVGLLALAVVFVIYLKWKNLGLAILLGIASHLISRLLT
jgi:branched-subunit amino acid transport protein